MEGNIFLKQYDDTHYNELINFDLSEEQINFTILPSKALEILEKQADNDNLKAITILLESKPIGFFILDYGQDKFAMTNNIKSLLLRSLSINSIYQGKGYGKKAMVLLDFFIKENYSDIEELVLAVNFKNTFAYQLYLKVGYLDEGKTREWRNGFQHLLRKKLM